METVRLIFAKGTVEAEKNGNCFITDKKPKASILADLTTVTIEEADVSTELHDAELQECASVDGRYWFTLREQTEAEAAAIQLRSDVDYLLLLAE